MEIDGHLYMIVFDTDTELSISDAHEEQNVILKRIRSSGLFRMFTTRTQDDRHQVPCFRSWWPPGVGIVLIFTDRLTGRQTHSPKNGQTTRHAEKQKKVGWKIQKSSTHIEVNISFKLHFLIHIFGFDFLWKRGNVTNSLEIVICKSWNVYPQEFETIGFCRSINHLSGLRSRLILRFF